MFGLATYWSLTPVPHNLVANDVDGRRPAALLEKAQPAPLNLQSKSMTTVDLDCLSKGKSIEFTGEANLLQLKGKLCSDIAVEALKIHNRTNSAKGTVFFTKNNQFMSDFISLAPGKNHIIVRLTYVDGKKVLNSLIFNSN